ncbi:MAG TPA: polysaccharide deacetylase family protein [Flavisolibacter sp.]|jgi:peptidoglycan/xylan/chitin deacetylase (PgdA/CDA1 family)|nr:polysaccharide deacetylase family protein [Flavisolibacter sp.]
METSSDDEGDSTSLLTKSTLIVLVLLPFALYKPKQQPVKILSAATASPPVVQTAAPMVEVEKPKPKKKKKKLYITFDDGPNKGTKNVMHIVKDEAVPVSFFVVGEHVFASPTQARLWDSLKMMQQIDICNHSYSHAHSRYERYYQQPDSVVKDFQRTHDSLQLTNTIARTPGRNIWRIDTLHFTDLKRSSAAADSLQKAGFALMGWDLEWHFDHKKMSVSTPAEAMVAQIDSVFKHRRTKKEDHLVLLAHDQVYQKSEDSFQLRQFFQLLKKKDDYEFSLATTYPGAMPLHDTFKRKPVVNMQ